MSDDAPATSPSAGTTDGADGADGGHDVSTPPGVPEREDSSPGLANDEGREDRPASDSVEGDHAGTLDVDDEQPDPDASTEETSEQRENTEASTEQPSQ